MPEMKTIAVLLTLLLAACASSDPPLQLAGRVDLDRYYGRWYIISEIPYVGERGNVGSYVEYSPLPDGHIKDVYYGREKTFDGKVDSMTLDDYVVADSNNAMWRVRLFWPIYVSYPILDVDPNYQVALVGYPDRSLGWVFARSPRMDDAAYAEAMRKFAAQGYDVSKFRKVAQFPEQIGQPGFE